MILEEVLLERVTGGPCFVLVANRARPDPQVPLDDLPGKGGRFDLVARFVNAALLTSHGIRHDARAIVVFAGVPDPVAMRVSGDAVTGIGPDERSTAARLLQALQATPMPVWQAVEDGIELKRADLETVLGDVAAPIAFLHEDGQPLPEAGTGAATFVLGDDRGFTDEQRTAVREAADLEVRVGPRPLQADHVAAILVNELDRRD